MIVLLLMQPHGYAAKSSVKSKHRAIVVTGKHVAEKKPVSVQIVSFPDTQWQAVKIIRAGHQRKTRPPGSCRPKRPRPLRSLPSAIRTARPSE
jgi:hypothetical protein